MGWRSLSSSRFFWLNHPGFWERMSSRKSDNLLPDSRAQDVSPWRATLLANVPLIVILLAMIPIGMALEGDWGRDNIPDYYRRVPMLIGFNIILAVSLQLINGFSGQFSLGHAGFMAGGPFLPRYPPHAPPHPPPPPPPPPSPPPFLLPPRLPPPGDAPAHRGPLPPPPPAP